MHDQSHPPYPELEPSDALDLLIAELLDCGGVLSQIVAAMISFQSGGQGALDEVPTPEIAHAVVRGVTAGLGERYAEIDLRTAAGIVADVTQTLCSEMLVVGPDLN